MKALARTVCLLLCLLLVAKGGVAAMLSTTGASGYAHPIADACPFGVLESFSGEHGGGEEPVILRSVPDDSSGGVHRLHHHHACPLLCFTLEAAPVPMPAASPLADSVPVQATASYSSQLFSPLLHPPRGAS